MCGSGIESIAGEGLPGGLHCTGAFLCIHGRFGLLTGESIKAMLRATVFVECRPLMAANARPR